jgi:uncharacterized protein YutE (UPF0331/DUF86 family)
MLDKSRLEHRLLDLERYYHRLSEVMPENLSDYAESEHGMKAAAERYLQLISDIEFDIVAQVYKAKELSIAGDERNLLERMNSILGKKITDSLRSRRSLRNKLVHAYYEVSYDEDVFGLGNDLNDVKEFIKAIKKILSTT